MTEPIWLETARKKLGVATFPKGQSNPRITEYHANTNIAGYDDKAAWCSTFLNWVFAQHSITGTGSALARSWLDWGVGLDSPQLGCVAVLEREDPDGWKGHVGFFLSMQGDQVVLLGGNQLNEVREHHYPVSSVLAYRSVVS